MRWLVLGVALIGLPLGVGCNDDETTQVVVVVDADPGIRRDLRTLSIEVFGSAAGGPEEPPFLRELTTVGWPVQVPLAPRDEDASRTFRIVATALDGSGPIARATLRSGYVEGASRGYYLLLEDSCRGQLCDGQTCRRGSCIDPFIPAENLPPWPLPPREGGMPDAGLDADAAVDPDGAIEDATVDAPDDASTDGAVDADATMDADAPLPPCPIEAGDLVITEVMVASRFGSGDLGEWFEVVNRKSCIADLNGISIISPNGSGFDRTHEITTSVLIGPGQYFVFAFSPIPDENLGIPFNYAYSAGGAMMVTDVVLNNARDSLRLEVTATEVVIDSVRFLSSDDHTERFARQFPPSITAMTNDDWSLSCDATMIYGMSITGDVFGTPGAINEPCP
ncbi:MAG: lamin tail domain-containing protein [Myxococcota bacterium]